MRNGTLNGTIADLEVKRHKLDVAIAALKALGGAVDRLGFKKKSRTGPTIIGAVLAHLKKARGPQTSEQLRYAITKAGVQATESSIQTLLSRRARLRKDLLRLGRGKWGLKR